MSRSDRVTIAAGGGALVLVLCAAWLLLAPPDAPLAGPAAGEAVPTAPMVGGVPGSAAPAPSSIVVDVQGAVAAPGVRELPAGTRIADAIAAAGGYAPDADLDATAGSLNLAKPLADGEQVRVPRMGDRDAAPLDGGSAQAGEGAGLVDLNSATPEELEALPGIGPVTVQKIVAARQELPFSSLDDAVTRGVLNRGQLEDIRGLATAG